MLKEEIITYLNHLDNIYRDINGPDLEIVICGGTALNLLGLISRPTKDIDLVAPETWPEELKSAAKITGDFFGLPDNWINAGPVDLLRMGLPNGFFDRCTQIGTQSKLKILITSRYDHVHFKLYACADRGGYHVKDLKDLNPTPEEIYQAALWTFTHDVSDGFRLIMTDFIKKQGWLDVATRLGK